MPHQKNETPTARATAGINGLLRRAADRAHRSLAALVELSVRGSAGKLTLQASAMPRQAGEG